MDVQNIPCVSEDVAWKSICKGGVKFVYSCLVKNDCNLQCMNKWSTRLNVTVHVKTIFLQAIRTTQDTYLRWLQYRILHRILPTQRLLFFMKISNSPLCSLCLQEEETLDHMFWECDQVQQFWSDFLDWLQSNFKHCRNLMLSKDLIVLGCSDGVHTDKVFNLFILLAKQCIFKAALNKTSPTLPMFVNILKQRFLIEKYNAYINNNYVNFTKDWCLYKDFFQ